MKSLKPKAMLPREKVEVPALQHNVPASISSLLSVKIGIDLVEVSKVQKVFGKKRSFQEAIFTPDELDYALSRRNPYAHLAARFAVKEALFKALGTGLSSEVDWREVEVQKEFSGRPVLRLSGRTARFADKTGVVGHTLSLTHTESHALAFVLLMLTDSDKASV
ncbi:MAG: holo-ACP synthase [Deltaproteobacteria bacterium]|nr:holo-ACP synthase [Deltaproteobacteria bacterium]